MTDSQLTNGICKRLHYQLIQCLVDHLSRTPVKHSFLRSLSSVLPPGIIAANEENIWQICYALESENIISIGNYQRLKQWLDEAGLMELLREVEFREKDIQKALYQERSSIQGCNVGSNDFGDTRQFGSHRTILNSETPSSLRQHSQLFNHLDRQLVPEMSEYRSFLTMVRAFLPTAVVSDHKGNLLDILSALQAEGHIGVGSYRVLKIILEGSRLNALKAEVDRRESQIQQAIQREKIVSSDDQWPSRCHQKCSGLNSIPNGGSEEQRADGYDEPRQFGSPGTSSESKTPNSLRLHSQLLNHLDRQLVPAMSEYRSFLTMVRAFLPTGVVTANQGNLLDILSALQAEGLIGVGNYRVLKIILGDCHLNALKADLERRESKIQQAIQQENNDKLSNGS